MRSLPTRSPAFGELMSETPITRRYQTEAIEAAENAISVGDVRRTLLVMATGTGKTWTFSRILVRRRDQGYGRALVLAHRIELVDQAAEALRAAGLTVEIESGDRLASIWGNLLDGKSDVVVATVQSLRGRRLERWPGDGFGTIVIDECFPAGTMISGVPIEDIVVGDVVPCINHKTGRVTERKVTRLYKSVRFDPLVRLRYGATEIDCTQNHPIFVKGRGYVEAREVAVGDLLCVWTSVFRGDKAPGSKNVFGGVQEKDLIGDYGAHKSRPRRAAYAGEEPDAPRERTRSSQRDTASNGPRAESSRWQQKAAYRGGKVAVERIGMANAGRREDADVAAVGIPDLLQDRRCERSVEDSDRNRRPKPLVAQGTRRRCEERGVLVWARVDSVESVEPASDAGTPVYNFEVAGTHTYFANGALVHNCHHAIAGSYRGVIERFPMARVIGVTATPDRGDGVGLGGIFDHVAYQYDLRQAIADGYLCPIRVHALTSAELDLASVRVTKQEHGRDLNAADLAAQLESNASLHALSAQIVEAVGARPTIVFTPSVLMAHRLADVLVHHTTAQTRALDGGSAKDDREAALQAYREGKVQFLINCALFTEGFDAPSTAAVVILRPTKSRALYAQMIGRGTRLAPGKVDCLVCDLTSNSDDHTLATPLDVLAGKPIPDDVRKLAQAAIADGESVDDALAKAEETARKREELRQARRAKKAETKIKARVKYEARMVDPFRDQTTGERRNPSPEERAAWSLQRLCERLIKAGVKVPADVTMEQAQVWMQRVEARRNAGLCSYKQAGWLKRQGLRWENVSKMQATYILNAARENGWRVPAHLRAEYGA